MLSLGIDFGTSTTVAALYVDGEATLMQNPDGQEITPSCVAFPPSGPVMVGAAAKRRRVIDPQNALYSMKRILGLAASRSEVRDFRAEYPFQIDDDPDGLPRFVTRNGRLTALETAAHVLTYVRSSPAIRAQRLGSVTLTAPTTFAPEQSEALREAARRAGFPSCEIIDEPRAAALATLDASPSHDVVAVYDLGGGTFDITVMRLAGDEYQVIGVGGDSYTDYQILGAGGDSYLGGDDIDLKCADWVVKKVLEERHWDIRSSQASFQKLRFACETAKMLLSLTDEQSIDLTGIDEVLRNQAVALSRVDLQRLCAELVRRTFIVCDEALASAGVTADGVDTVILSGGCCHLPFIQEGVASYFRRTPLVSKQPDRVVALGAALHAGRNAA